MNYVYHTALGNAWSDISNDNKRLSLWLSYRCGSIFFVGHHPPRGIYLGQHTTPWISSRIYNINVLNDTGFYARVASKYCTELSCEPITPIQSIECIKPIVVH